MKFDKKHSTALFVLMMAFLLSMVMSAVMTLKLFGFHGNFPSVWMSNWTFSFIVAFPTAYIIVPLVRKIVDKLTG